MFKKSGQDRERNRKLANSILNSFFIGERPRPGALVAEVDPARLEQAFAIRPEQLVSELVEKTQKYERMLNPHKKYFLSGKIKMVNPTVSKGNSRKIVNFIADLTRRGEYVAIDGFYSDSSKFFIVRPKTSEPSSRDARRRSRSRDKESRKKKQKKRRHVGVPSESEDSGDSPKPSGLEREFMETINRSSTDLSLWKENCEETRVDLAGEAGPANRSFFGYYNFHNFFNHFVILYERLKFMKALTDPHGVFGFLKTVMMLNFAGVIEFEFYEDVIGCLLFEYSGVFLNLERILSNVVKEIPSHEIDRFVIDLNRNLFDPPGDAQSESIGPAPLPRTETYPASRNREEWLFVKTCHKLSSLTFKSKASCKQSQIQSYINNNNLVNDHLLMFEFRTSEQVFVIHKIRSLFRHAPKKVGFLPKTSKSSLAHFVATSAEYLNRPLRGPLPNWGSLPREYRACLTHTAVSEPKKHAQLSLYDSENRLKAFSQANGIIEEGGAHAQGRIHPTQPPMIREIDLTKEPEHTDEPERTATQCAQTPSGRVDLQRMRSELGKRVFVRNEILYEYLWKPGTSRLFASRKEDKLFALRETTPLDSRRRHRLRRLQKVSKFRQFINKRLK